MPPILPGVLVDPTWLEAALGAPGLVVVDCRFDLARPGAGREAYLGGHLPGARFLDLDADLSAPVRPDRIGGRHPLPAPEAFAAAARRAGIGGDSAVVAYDSSMSGGAARLWWLLRHVGHDRAAVLEGGLAAWTGPLTTGEEPETAPGDLQVQLREGDTVDAATLAAGLGRPGTTILDARAPERFRGDAEPIDPVAGHIPGSRNLPLTASDRLAPELVASPDQLVASCGSGVAACVLVLRLAAAGRHDARLYPGSWSDWIARGLPVATGD